MGNESMPGGWSGVFFGLLLGAGTITVQDYGLEQTG